MSLLLLETMSKMLILLNMKTFLQKFKWFIAGAGTVAVLTAGISYAALIRPSALSDLSSPKILKGQIPVGSTTIDSFTLINTSTAGTVLSMGGNGLPSFVATNTLFSSIISSLNGLTVSVQTFATDTSGTIFHITSAGSTHTFSLPIASASNTGQLQSSDFSRFNGFNAAWTIGSGLINNATSTDAVLVGTSTPTTAQFFIQGQGTKNPLTIASSTGAQLLTVFANGQVLIGNGPISAQSSLTVSTLSTDTPANLFGISPVITVAATTGANNRAIRGLNASVTVGASNTQDWTNATPITAATQIASIASGAAGTITGLIGNNIALSNLSAAATTTNGYLYLANFGSVTGPIISAAGMSLYGLGQSSTNSVGLQLTVANSLPAIPTGRFGVYDSTGYVDYFAGNVGINTTTPGQPLVVVGSTTITSLGAGCVTSTASGALAVATCGTGTVTSVSGAGSIISSGGTTPTLQLQNLTSSGVLFGQGNSTIATSSSFTYNSVSNTLFLASSTISGFLTVTGTSTLATTTISKLIYTNASGTNESLSGTLNVTSTSTLGAITGSSILDSALSSGNCVQAGAGGVLTTVAAACGVGTVTSVSGSGSVTSTGGATPTIALQNLTTADLLFGQGNGTFATSSNLTFSNNTLAVTGTSTVSNVFLIGTTTLTSPFISATLLGLAASTTGFAEVNIVNHSPSTTASSDYVLTADKGTSATYYSDIFQNSSGFVNTGGLAGGPYDAGHFSSDASLYLGTSSTTNTSANIYLVAQGTQIATGTKTGLLFSNATSSSFAATNLVSGNCLQASTGGLITTTGSACSAGGGNSAWTIGNGLIYNGNTTGSTTGDSVLVGTTTPTTANFFVMGSSTKTSIATFASSSGQSYFQVLPSGAVTIGTTTPFLQGSGLTISGDSTHAAVLQLYSISNNVAELALGNLAGTNLADVFIQSALGSTYGGPSSLNLLTATSSPIAFLTNSSSVPKMIILSNGNVGINTTTPTTTLAVYGTGTTDILVVASSSNASIFTIFSNGAESYATSTNNGTTTVTYAGQYFSADLDNGTTSSITFLIDWAKGNVQRLVLATSTTISFARTQSGGRYLLELHQDGTGSRTVTWPASVHFPAGTAPTLTTGAGKTDIITFVCVTNGTCFAGSNLNYSP